MERCEEVRKVLLDYLLGELSQDKAERVRAHLEECRECQEEYRNLKEVVELTATATSLKAPQEVYENLKEAVTLKRPRPRVLRRLVGVKVPVFRAAALILLAAVILAVPAIYLKSRRAAQPPLPTEEPVVTESIPPELAQIPADAEAALEAYVAEELVARAPASLAEFKPRLSTDGLEALVKERIAALIAANSLDAWRPVVAPLKKKEKEEKDDGSSSDINPNHSHLDPEHRTGICGVG